MDSKVNQRRFWYWLVGVILVAGLILTPVGTVQAAERDDDGTIEASETIDDDVIVVSKDIIVDGTVNGTLMAFGNMVTINGTINGDVIAMGSTVKFTKEAEISGNVFAAGQYVEAD